MNEVRVTDPSGRLRWHIEKICPICSRSFLSRKDKKETLYCGKDCYNKARDKRTQLKCDECGLVITKTANKITTLNFCSRACKDKNQQVENPKRKYREKAFANLDNNCNRCGYKELKRMLDVHHIDGNRSNSRLHNLEILCVWCHALETRKDWPE